MARRTWWKVGALLAAMMMFLTMLPVTALAADGDTVYVGGEALTGTAGAPVYATTDDSGKVTVQSSYTEQNSWQIKWDGSTLTLNGAKIKGADSSESISITVGIYAFNSSGDVSLNIALQGVNEIFESSNGIWVYSSSSSTNAGNATLTIEGEGSLNASGSSSGILVQSNSGDAALTIQNADVTAENSIYSGDGVTVRAGSSSSASLSVDGGSLTATGKSELGAGIRYTFGGGSSGSGKPSLTVSGNAMVKASGDTGGITSNSSTVTPSGTGIVFNNGTGTVYGSVTLQEDLTIGEDESLDIPSGASLTIPSGATLTNKGEVTTTGGGTLTNNGTINNSGTLPGSIGGNGAVNHAPTITTQSLPDGTEGTSYSQTLTATGTAPFTWDVSSGSLPAGLSLNEDTGVVSGTPTTAGTSTFTVTASNVCGSDSKQLSITINKSATVPVTGVTLNRTELSLPENQTATLAATVEPDNATNKDVTWSSSDGAIATVNADGVVTAVAPGTAIVAVTTVDQNKTATCTVTVTPATVSVTGVTLSQDSMSLNKGDSEALTATVLPADATNKNVTWSSSDEAVATVSADGVVTACGAGEATITVTTEDGGFTDACRVTVTVPTTGVTLSKDSVSLFAGDSEVLTATVQPADATNQEVAWSTSDDHVATVDASGNVTAVGAGTATITVTTADGGKTATCTVTVSAKTFGISASPALLDFGSVYTGYAQPAAQTVTVTNTGNQSVTLTQPTSTNFEIGALSATALAPNDSVAFSVRPKPGLSAGTYHEMLAITGTGGASCAVDLSFSVSVPYVPPRPTGPDWDDVAGDIASAAPGSTVKVDMDGTTVLPGEVLDELAGRDVTLALDMGDGVSWEIDGGDVPAGTAYDDVDLGVGFDGDAIPVDVVDLVAGEHGSVQMSLAHDGPFAFALTLVAPLGEDAAGLVANLYRYDDEAGSLGYEASAQVDDEGVARLPFGHASSWLVALDSRSHELPFPDAHEGTWYSEAVRWAWLNGVMTGYADGPLAGLFGTGDVLTRSQLAAALYNAAGKPEVDSALVEAFPDCDPDAWYAEAVAWAASQGLMTGYDDGTGRFGPDDGLTREQLVTVFWRAAGEPSGNADLSAFPDGDEISAWATEPVAWAVSCGLLRGYDDTGELGPIDPLERAQLAAVLMRLAQVAA